MQLVVSRSLDWKWLLRSQCCRLERMQLVVSRSLDWKILVWVTRGLCLRCNWQLGDRLIGSFNVEAIVEYWRCNWQLGDRLIGRALWIVRSIYRRSMQLVVRRSLDWKDTRYIVRQAKILMQLVVRRSLDWKEQQSILIEAMSRMQLVVRRSLDWKDINIICRADQIGMQLVVSRSLDWKSQAAVINNILPAMQLVVSRSLDWKNSPIWEPRSANQDATGSQAIARLDVPPPKRQVIGSIDVTGSQAIALYFRRD